MFCLYGCFVRQEIKQTVVIEQLVADNDLPIGAIPVGWHEGSVIYEMILFDSIKFKVIIDSGVSSFFLDSTYLSKLGFGYQKEGSITVIMQSPSPWGGSIKSYRSSLPLNASPLFGNNANNIRLLNFSKFAIDTTYIKGIIPLNAFSKEIIQINLKDRYILPLDSINDDGYIKLPLELGSNLPSVVLNMLITKDNNLYEIGGKFLIDYGYRGYICINQIKLDNVLFPQVRDTVTVQFNGITEDDVPIYKRPLTVDELAGVLGNKFLLRFDVIIDYKRKYFYLKPYQTI